MYGCGLALSIHNTFHCNIWHIKDICHIRMTYDANKSIYTA